MPVLIYPINLFETSFFNSPHIELSTNIIGIGNKFLVHPLYQTVPVGVPHGSEIVEVGTHYHDLNYAVMAGDSTKKAEREIYREKSVLTTSLALNWAGMRYLRENNLELITNLGVESKKKHQPRATAPTQITTPGKLVLKRSDKSGALHLGISRVDGAFIYLVQACLGDPNDESAWKLEWQFTKIKGGVELTGLEPGKVYYVRVRCFGHAGYGPWSTYEHIMVA